MTKRQLLPSTIAQQYPKSVMLDSTPGKRRKTRGSSMSKLKIEWPAESIPVEIFTLIVDFLPRSNIQNLRLVNKEFDRKVSEALFRVVVVPFRPEIYGINTEPVLNNDELKGAIMIQDKGMRVFQGFGRWIQKFAMSFEIDHHRLANPPSKCDQEAITTFWGIYRWPFQMYNRYAALEGLEQTADETRTMAKALMFVSGAKELGLSIDAGLGWLPGPDINTRVAERGVKLAVFGESRFVPETKPKTGKGKKQANVTQNESRYDIFTRDITQWERMLLDAGYRDGNLPGAVRLLLDHEENRSQPRPDSTRNNNYAYDNYASTALTDTSRPGDFLRHRRRAGNLVEGTNGSNSTGRPTPHASFNESVSTDEDEDDAPDFLPAFRIASLKAEAGNLKPNDLSTAQREMLLEFEWAQNAFMQSWAIAILDNHETFHQIKALTIARLPSHHVSILRREDFWDSLPQLNKLSLAIIPDWREIKKEATSFVADIRLAPSRAVTAVYELLSQQISDRPNIKTLHLEWLGGGEYAPGLFARNQHVLAAPVVAEAIHMINRAQEHPVLSLPYVEHLSLKNCWLSPHVMSAFLLPLKETALRSLTLDSVSLTATLPSDAAPAPSPAGVAHNAQHQMPAGALLIALAGAQQLNNAPPALPAANSVFNTTAWFTNIRRGSWAEIINSLTPGMTLETIRYNHSIDVEPEIRPPQNLLKLSFTSCGYVRLPYDFDQTAVDNPAREHQAGSVHKRISDIEGVMMRPQDPLLATIVNYMNDNEAATLDHAWNMTVGWGNERAELLADAQLDGCSNAGKGRFDGLIEETPIPMPVVDAMVTN